MADSNAVVKQVFSYLEEIRDSLLCPICLELLRSPNSTPCGHTFCYECIEYAVSSVRRPRCPICKAKVTRRCLQGNQYLEGLVSAVKQLEASIVMDTGGFPSSPEPVVYKHRNSTTTGTPGILQHKMLHPSPRKC